MKRRIAIVASHPVQYHAHWYRELAQLADLEVEVLYCHRATPEDQRESGFGVSFEWDVPLLGGYRHRFLTNVSRSPGVSEFSGTDVPELRGIIIHERFDAVVVSGWHTKSYWQAIRACWASGTPVMVRSDSHLHEDRPALKRILKWLPYRYFIRRFDACLAAGIWSRDYFLHYGARPERVFIVPHCCAAARLPIPKRGRDAANCGVDGVSARALPYSCLQEKSSTGSGRGISYGQLRRLRCGFRGARTACRRRADAKKTWRRSQPVVERARHIYRIPEPECHWRCLRGGRCSGAAIGERNVGSGGE